MISINDQVIERSRGKRNWTAKVGIACASTTALGINTDQHREVRELV